MVRRAVLAAIAVGLPFVWAFIPFGSTVDMIGTGEATTFAGAAVELVREALESKHAIGVEHAILAIGFFGLLSPLYPAAIAALLLSAPRRMAARRRLAWIAEGAIVLVLSPAGCLLAILSVSILLPDAPPPRLWWPLWLLAGCAALGGLAAIWVGIAGRGRLARIALG